jgi:hypothetical protein
LSPKKKEVHFKRGVNSAARSSVASLNNTTTITVNNRRHMDSPSAIKKKSRQKMVDLTDNDLERYIEEIHDRNY